METRGKAYIPLPSLPMILIPNYLFLLLFLTVAITGGQILYNHPDNIALDCGSFGSYTSESNRTWKGDFDSAKVFPPSLDQNNASRASKVPAGFTSAYVPYRTARLSHSGFTYTIPVTPGPMFIRLHFFAAQYENFNLSESNAFFSAEADSTYTLLHNFSVFLTAGDSDNPVVTEFLVVAKRSVLNITFTPSSSISGAVAFVNGIEVVSIPNNLYFPESEQPGLYFVPQKSQYIFRKDTALATMYRLNIGGGAYSDHTDTGMFRNWENGIDNKYLTIPGSSVGPSFSEHVHFTYPRTPNYSAPEGVYQTARSMGLNKTEVMSYKLTWEFPVHPQFDYLVRLHFCEIGTIINQINDRVFRIFFIDEMVEDRADVIFWSGGKYVPYFKDYVVQMRIEKKPNLSVALQAYSDGSISRYADAILNGIEIFKLNSSVGNLAGPNPDPKSKITLNVPTPKSQGKGLRNLIVIIVMVSIVVVLFVIGGFFIIGRARKVKYANPSNDGTSRGYIFCATNKSSKTEGSLLPSDLCRHFSFAEIRAATKDFDDKFVIGVGGFGNVYKGYIDDGTTLVAIKRLKPESSQGVNEFKSEIEMLSYLRHRHLVSLIGYCNDGHEMILVYDYMANETLRHHLYNSENSPLSWKQRFDICIGAARGLQYLHTGTMHPIIHRDVKTTNILLDEKWVAKVSDFGLSKVGPTGSSKTHVTTEVKGSLGYMDPEYYKRQQLSEKTDVYSFGVVLCEVLCARPPILRTVEKEKICLANWVPNCFHDGTINQIIDPYLSGKIAPECLKKYSEIIVSCLLEDGMDRPSMNEIVWGLEFAMQLQKSAEDNHKDVEEFDRSIDENDLSLLKHNFSDGTFDSRIKETTETTSSGFTKFSSIELSSTTNESIKGMSGIVFSEINTDPKGR